jgi:hypothetical protein
MWGFFVFRHPRFATAWLGPISIFERSFVGPPKLPHLPLAAESQKRADRTCKSLPRPSLERVQANSGAQPRPLLFTAQPSERKA